MKKLLLLAVIFFSFSAKAQTRYEYYVDSAFNNKISVTAEPLVAIWGQWANLLNKPTTISTMGLTDVYNKHQIDSMLALKASNNRSYSLSTRTLNTAFQPSTTNDCIVIYYVQITSNLSLTGGQSGSVQLQTSPTNVTYTNTGTNTNNNTGTLTIGINTSAVQTACVISYVPKGYYVKLVSSGTSAFAYQNGIEISL